MVVLDSMLNELFHSLLNSIQVRLKIDLIVGKIFFDGRLDVLCASSYDIYNRFGSNCSCTMEINKFNRMNRQFDADLIESGELKSYLDSTLPEEGRTESLWYQLELSHFEM